VTSCFFVSDLHGNVERYRKLFDLIAREPPAAVFMGGDLLPSESASPAAPPRRQHDFINDVLVTELTHLRQQLGKEYPWIFLILGNDDARLEEAAVLDAARQGLWGYVHNRQLAFGKYQVYGYANVPPTPLQLKDWEQYDVSHYVDPGCISPEEGHRTVPVTQQEVRNATIAEDLQSLVRRRDLMKAVFLFHTPPYNTNLDRAALDGKLVDHVPVDVHVGSMAVREFIEIRQPMLTLHGHVHESARLTGSWRDQIGRTFCFSAAHDGPELALIRFDLEHPEDAARELI
jgi:Icc-related predicted phosphoesterase